MRNILNRKYILTILLMLPMVANSGSVVGSKHDLSNSNFYGAFAGSSTQVCVFCHTPHSSNSGLADAGGANAPIWNRRLTNLSAFTLYDSSVGTPSSISLACLSCHDGASGMGRVSAVGPVDAHNVINASGTGLAGDSGNGGETPNCAACHPFARPSGGTTYPSTTWQIGADLTDDHPISINYAASFAHNPDEFLSQPANGLKLFNGLIECATCHNVHDNDNGLFLRTSNMGSGVCKSCHVK